MKTLLALKENLYEAIDVEGLCWLKQARTQLVQLNGDIDLAANKLVFLTATAKRILGMTSLNGEIISGYKPDNYGQCSKVHLGHLSVTDAARIFLLAETLATELFAADELFQLCYRYSDGGERVSLLKGLTFFELSEQSTEFIIDAARTNSLEIFSALVYKNPWPVINFPVSAYNQIVLKSLFMGINILHLEGLRANRNSELGRMTADYVQERLDAGREIPESIWLAVDARCLTKQGLSAWESALKGNPSESKNQLALLACQWQPDLPQQLLQITQSLNNF